MLHKCGPLWHFFIIISKLKIAEIGVLSAVKTAKYVIKGSIFLPITAGVLPTMAPNGWILQVFGIIKCNGARMRTE